jgi:hypothetical protein
MKEMIQARDSPILRLAPCGGVGQSIAGYLMKHPQPRGLVP